MSVKERREVQHINIQIDVPETVQIPKDYDLRVAQIALMYKQGIMSGGEAAQSLGVPARDVIDHLSKYGVAAANIENRELSLGNVCGK